jgi:hypothetical protein
MPNAVLTGANLYGVSASYCQFYGDTARIDGSAILEEAQLNDANLSGVDFSQAQLMGANLSGAQLFNASFNAARLGPSANGGNANLTGANLQGADFTDAELYSATLAGAAVAITIPTQNVPQQGAVYLFSLPRTRDGTTLQQYLTEIEAASNWFSLNPDGDTPTLQKYVTALQENDLGVLEVPFQGQKPPISLSSSAKITSVQNGVWQIIDGTNSYTLFESTDVNGNTELYASTSLVLTQAAFKTAEMALRPQTFVTTDTPEQQWLLDNDSEDPQNTDLGYVEFLLHLNGDMLDVYGIAIHVQRLADDNTLQIETESCNLTTLGAENMNGATVCPNGIPLSVNQTNGNGTWSDEWLRTAAPPKPPQCVPTNNSWCPPPTVAGNADSANLPSTGV